MQQAGEADAPDPAADHVQELPPAIFSFYVPKIRKQTMEQFSPKVREELKRLQRFPVTNAVIQYPTEDTLYGSDCVQVEPEVALFCDIEYEELEESGKTIKRVKNLIPRKIAAFNDCSVRKLEGAEHVGKLSEKKNWGHASKGISLDAFMIDCFEPKTPEGQPSLVSRLWITSYVWRNHQVYQYTRAAPARYYVFFHLEISFGNLIMGLRSFVLRSFVLRSFVLEIFCSQL